MKQRLLVAGLLIACAASAVPALALPGVGYFPLNNAVSHAGQAYGCPLYLLNTAIDPWANGTFDRSKMAGRYGPCWENGAPGPHSTDYANYLRTDFAARKARWNPDYSLYDGVPLARETTDAYFTQDSRVLPLRPTPTPTPPATTPVSAFGWTPNAVYAGTPVSFVDASTNLPTAWYWTFQDGSPATSSTKNPVVTFGNAGVKTITLRASNGSGAGTTAWKTITVLPGTTPNPTPTPTPNPTPTPTPTPGPPAPNANFSFSPSAPHAGDVVSFDGAFSTNVPAGTTYSWDFGDGFGGSGPQVSHVFAASAYFTVRLTLTPPGCASPSCQGQMTKLVAVAGALPPSGPQPKFSVSPAAPGAAESAVFDSAASVDIVPGSTFTWLFNDGSPIAIGPIVDHAFPGPGSYNVVLSVAPPGCAAASCLQVAAKVVAVGARPPVLAEFTADTSCQFQCAAATGRSVTLRATDDSASSYSWTFGDGGTALGRQVYHSWMTPGTFTATLTTTKGTASASKSRGFVISGAPPAARKAVLLPWVAQTRSQPTLVQSSDLYVLNPGTTPLEVGLEFRQRGFYEIFPPRTAATIQPGGMVYVPDMVRGLFHREDVSGFLTVSTAADAIEPVLTALNSSGASASKLFGNAVAGSLVAAGGGSAGSSYPVQHLVGLSDSARRQSSFGLTNPTDQSITYRLRFFDKTGRSIGDTGDAELDRYAQRLFGVQELRDDFGVAGLEDYRVEVETVSGPAPVPFGTDLWLSSGDPSVTRPGTARTAKAYLLGVLNGPGGNRTTLQTDLVLANVGGQTAQASLSFTKASTKAAGPTLDAAPFAVPAGTTTRLDNVLAAQLGSKSGVGVLTVTTTSLDGTYPVVLAESFDNTNPAKRYGQTIGALGDADVADATHRLELAGLRNDKATKATIFLFNPGGAAAEYDLVYRAPSGVVLGTLKSVKLAAGQLRQLDQTMHPTKKGASNGFSVEVVVKSGKALGAAQLTRTSTQDPAYVVGVVR